MSGGHLAWAVPNATSKYGGALLTAPRASADHMAATQVAGPALETSAPAWSPDNPLFWVAAIGAVSFGLMAFSTTVRVGHTKVSAAVGAT